MSAFHIHVAKDNLSDAQVVTGDAPEALNDGEVVLKVDAFALTANNITYAVMGDMMKYWNFFPAPEGKGRVPVWGFGDVVASKADGIQVGERFYGYFPVSTHLKVEARNVDEAGFSDGAAHRAEMSPIYSRYTRVANDSGYRADKEAEHMLLQPLFMTSFLIDDFLADEDFFGAKKVLVGSASSKTAIALAFMLSRRDGISVVGLTSSGNKAFVESLGYYDEVVTYDQIGAMDGSEKVVYVDMSGDGNVRADVHNLYKDNLAYDCAVGLTHYDKMSFGQELPGPASELFFAPDQARKRVGDWGAMGLQSRVGEAWLAFVDAASGWLDVTRANGPEAVTAIYQEVLSGKANPRAGFVLSLWD